MIDSKYKLKNKRYGKMIRFFLQNKTGEANNIASIILLIFTAPVLS